MATRKLSIIYLCIRRLVGPKETLIILAVGLISWV